MLQCSCPLHSIKTHEEAWKECRLRIQTPACNWASRSHSSSCNILSSLPLQHQAWFTPGVNQHNFTPQPYPSWKKKIFLQEDCKGVELWTQNFSPHITQVNKSCGWSIPACNGHEIVQNSGSQYRESIENIRKLKYDMTEFDYTFVVVVQKHSDFNLL